jgi:zinc transporter ZupT
MNRRWVWSAFFLLPALVAGYIAWLSWRAGDDGKWMFSVFAGFFLVLAAAPFIPASRRPPPEAAPATRFVPHWFMLLAVLLFAVMILLAIIGAILRR